MPSVAKRSQEVSAQSKRPITSGSKESRALFAGMYEQHIHLRISKELSKNRHDDPFAFTIAENFMKDWSTEFL